MKLTNALNAAGFAVQNILDAVNPQDAVSLAQLNAAVQGYSWKGPARAATTAHITLSGLQTIDGVSLVAGDRVLVKNQTSAAANGIYVVAAGAWPRATDLDTGAEAIGATAFVSEGLSQGNSTWTQTTDAPVTLNTTTLVFTQSGGGASYTAGNGVTLNGGVIAVDASVVARKASATIGDGTATTLTVTHNLGTLDVVVSVRAVATGEQVLVDNLANSANTVQLIFGTAPGVGQYRVTVTG
jgi:hypothetical protein